MAEYIEREAVKEAIGFIKLHFVACEENKSLLDVINEVPAADVVPVVRGRWIHDINNLYGCSECLGRETMSPKKLKPYCPNCGARMDGE